METKRWINQSQPQTMQIAVFLLYLTAAFQLLFGLDFQYVRFLFDFDLLNRITELILRIAIPVGAVVAGYGIANERRWGWRLGVGVAALPLVFLLYVTLRHQINPLDLELINLLFDIALFALLVHPMTREYEKVWFK